MRVSVDCKYAIGDHVAVTPQRTVVERNGDHADVILGQVVSIRIEYRGPQSAIVSYLLEMAGRSGPIDSMSFEESVLEPFES